MKKKIIIIIVILSIFFISGFIIFNKPDNKKYTYEWVEEKDSVIGQHRLYIKDSKGKYVDGQLDITYLNGKTETVKVSKDGNLYVKSVIKEVSNVKK